MSGENAILMPTSIVLTKQGKRIKIGPARDLVDTAHNIGAALHQRDQDGNPLWTPVPGHDAPELITARAERGEGWGYYNGLKGRMDIPAYVIASQAGIARNPRARSGKRFAACLVLAIAGLDGQPQRITVRPFEVGGARHDDVNDRMREDLASSLQAGDIVTLHRTPGVGDLMLRGITSRHGDAHQPQEIVQLTIDAVSQDGYVLFDRHDYNAIPGSKGRSEPVSYPKVDFDVFRPLPEGVLETLIALEADLSVAERDQEVAFARAA